MKEDAAYAARAGHQPAAGEPGPARPAGQQHAESQAQQGRTVLLAVRPAGAADVEPALAACRAAFADEAVVRWAAPTEEEFDQQFGESYRDALTGAIRDGQLLVAVTAEDEIAGVLAFLELPSADPIRQEAEQLGLAARDSGALPRRLAAVAAATAAVHPDVPHYFVSSMAVRPPFRGRGAGSALLHYALTRADAAGRPTYLEASTPDNRRLYARFGFRDTGEPLALPDGGPVLQPMWRDSGTS